MTRGDHAPPDLAGLTDALLAAARAAGHPDLLVPPTYLAGLETETEAIYRTLEDVGVDLAAVLNGEQHFTHHRPLHAGDEIVFTTRVTDVYARGGGRLEFLVRESAVVLQDIHAIGRQARRNTGENEQGHSVANALFRNQLAHPHHEDGAGGHRHHKQDQGEEVAVFRQDRHALAQQLLTVRQCDDAGGLQQRQREGQVAGVLGFISKNVKPRDGYIYLFAGVDKVRFKRQVIPGDQLILRAKKTMERHSIYKFSCTACVGDELAASAEITIAEQRTQYHQS